MDIGSQDKLVLFIAFIIPGFIAIKVYEILYPGKKERWCNNYDRTEPNGGIR